MYKLIEKHNLPIAEEVMALPSGPSKVVADEGPLRRAPGSAGPTRDKGPPRSRLGLAWATEMATAKTVKTT